MYSIISPKLTFNNVDGGNAGDDVNDSAAQLLREKLYPISHTHTNARTQWRKTQNHCTADALFLLHYYDDLNPYETVRNWRLIFRLNKKTQTIKNNWFLPSRIPKWFTMKLSLYCCCWHYAHQHERKGMHNTSKLTRAVSVFRCVGKMEIVHSSCSNTLWYDDDDMENIPQLLLLSIDETPVFVLCVNEKCGNSTTQRTFREIDWSWRKMCMRIKSHKHTHSISIRRICECEWIALSILCSTLNTHTHTAHSTESEQCV